jgi:glycosyltransferase involved in cell wall biosynthesis
MAAGLPVIVSDQVGIHQEVARARAGAVVRCDACELSSAIIGALQDQPLCQEMGRKGEWLVQTQYSLESITRQLIAVYDEIAN